jgi:hypothetical protein
VRADLSPGEAKVNSLRLLLAIVLLVFAGDSFAGGNKPPKPATKDKSPAQPLPSFDLVTKQVQQVLALDPDYQTGDLLTAPKVEQVLSKLAKINWKVADAREIVKLVLSDNDWMAERLSTAEGRDFMRHIAQLPGGYDRVDRLRDMPNGQSNVSDFIDSPGGYTMIEYMTTTRGGENLGEQLSDAVNGADFNKPTGRIYTERELLKRLRISYDAEVDRRAGLGPKPTTKAGKPESKTKWKSKGPWKPNRTARPQPIPDTEEPMAPQEFQDGVPQP